MTGPGGDGAAGPSIGARIAQGDWQGAAADLDDQGWALLPAVLDQRECEVLRSNFSQDTGFRSRVIMARHGFGSGEYRYFDHPLPPLVSALRQSLYPHLVPIANDWRRRRGGGDPFPDELDAFLERCRDAGQFRPTPLLLHYVAGDYNRLHQDLYGEVHFPLQAVVLLSRPGHEFEGGEFVLTEQKPRSQSRVDVVAMGQGDVVVFAVNDRPIVSTRGETMVRMRHGVSRVRSGDRFALGVIFHDAV